MSALAERLRKLEVYRYRAFEDGEPLDIWPELCAVVEAAERYVHRDRARTERGMAMFEDSLGVLARRMDEEGL